MLKGGLVLIWELDMNLEPTLLHTLKLMILMANMTFYDDDKPYVQVEENVNLTHL